MLDKNLRLHSDFYSLLMHVPALIAVLRGPEHVYELANPLYYQVVGRGPEIIGKPIREALPELQGQGIYELLDNVYQSGVAYRNSELKVRIEKERIPTDHYFNFIFEPVKNELGEVNGIFVHASDITEQVIARMKLEESEEQFRSFVLNSPVPTGIYIGPEMRIQMANEALLATWDKTPDVIGKTFREALPELEGQPFYKLLDEVYTTGIPYKATEDRVFLYRNGRLEETYYNFVYKALRKETGEIYGVINTGVEITELVKARNNIKVAEEKLEEQVRVRTEELEEVNADLVYKNEQLQQFAYVASHDLQEPLRKINLYGDRLLRDYVNGKEVNESYLQKIIGAAGRMTNLIKDLLNFSQIDSKEKALHPVNLNLVAERVREDYEIVISAKSAIIQIDHLGEIEANPLQMNQLFYNLIGNALKFSKTSEPPNINITSRTPTREEILEFPDLDPKIDYKELIFSDNGIGFAQQFAKQIFVIFQRLHGSSHFEGTGIGLALCKKIVDFHHGEIFAMSKEGEGSSFHIFLPIRRISADLQPRQPNSINSVSI